MTISDDEILDPGRSRHGGGVRCERCGGTTSVVDSRASLSNTIRRRRKCDDCGVRCTTFELIADSLAVRRSLFRAATEPNPIYTSMTLDRRKLCEAIIHEMMEHDAMSLTDEEQQRLSEILAAVDDQKLKMRTSEREFITDIELRFNDQGGELRLSRRQWNWLEDIMVRYA